MSKYSASRVASRFLEAQLTTQEQEDILKDVAAHFKRRYKLDTEIDPDGNVWGEGPLLDIWDEGDEPVYRPTLSVEYDDINGWDISVHSGGFGTSHGYSSSVGDKASARDIIREAEKVCKKKAPSLLR